ncbi:MAG: hypothetical protein ACREMY_29135, partial [bacterium]
MKRTLAIVLLTLFASTASAEDTCDMSTFETAVATCSDVSIGSLQGKLEQQVKARRKAQEAAATAAAETDLSKTNKATTAPDPFASRLHNSYQDFLTPFSFAINKVEESKDGQAVIVRFNPIRNENGLNGGITGTAAKPSILDKVSAAIPEGVRGDTAK